MTTLGKLLVFVLTACSLTAVGICFWLYIDYKDLNERQARIDGLRSEIDQRLKIQQKEADRLQELVFEMQAGQRKMDTIQVQPGQPFQLAPKAPVPVADVKRELEQQEAELKQVEAQISGLQGDVNRLLGELKESRTNTESAYEEQHRLWEAIHEPKIDGHPQPSFHDLIREAQQAKQTAEEAQTGLKPALINALAELTILQQRHEQLANRLAELRRTTALR